MHSSLEQFGEVDVEEWVKGQTIRLLTVCVCVCAYGAMSAVPQVLFIEDGLSLNWKLQFSRVMCWRCVDVVRCALCLAPVPVSELVDCSLECVARLLLATGNCASRRSRALFAACERTADALLGSSPASV